MKTQKSKSLDHEQKVIEQMMKRIFIVAEIVNQSDFYQQNLVRHSLSDSKKTQK